MEGMEREEGITCREKGEGEARTAATVNHSNY